MCWYPIRCVHVASPHYVSRPCTFLLGNFNAEFKIGFSCVCEGMKRILHLQLELCDQHEEEDGDGGKVTSSAVNVKSFKETSNILQLSFSFKDTLMLMLI